MLDKLKRVSPTRWATIILLAISAGFLSLSVYMTFSIDVLQDWKLELPEEKIRVGDTIIVKSLYTKIRDADGESVRYIDCKDKSGSFLRYEINRKRANRAAKMGGTGIQLTMPTVPDLPATCKIAVVITYDALPWRKVIESNETKDFILYPKEVSSAKSESNESQKTNQTLPVVEGQSSNQEVSSSNTTSTTETRQSNNSQKSTTRSSTTTTTTPPPTQERTITGVEPLDTILKEIGL